MTVPWYICSGQPEDTSFRDILELWEPGWSFPIPFIHSSGQNLFRVQASGAVADPVHCFPINLAPTAALLLLTIPFWARAEHLVL